MEKKMGQPLPVYNIKVDYERDNNLTDFAKDTLSDRYLLEGEDYQQIFARVAKEFADDQNHAQRLYDYMSKLWFVPATPVLANGGANRGYPISCYLNECTDSLESISNLWMENVWLASKGGGIGSYWGNIRSIGEQIKNAGKTAGVIPFLKVTDSLTLAISQGSLRRGSAAIYMPIWHPEIEEFIEIRRPTGGDINRKTLNTHHGVVIDDYFMNAVKEDKMWQLTSPKNRDNVIAEVSARSLWIRLLTARIETGEPYILFIDSVNRGIPEHHKKSGLFVKTSNLCSEITLPTGIDHLGKQRTAVCCLSSVNMVHYEKWSQQENFIEDIMRFLDNVLQSYIDNAHTSMEKARYSAERERSVGLGVMGFHSFLQSKNLPFESVTAKAWNKKIFKFVKDGADAASKKLAIERGPCKDAKEHGHMERFSNKIAIAPTASISIIAGSISAGIEPFVANSFTHKTLSGSQTVKNEYLKELLRKKGQDTDKIWSSISVNGGSVAHLDFLTDYEKSVFKTAFEIDQMWVVEHAADRTPYICQSQSLNIFVRPDIHKQKLHDIHYKGWEKGIKSFYYARSQAIQRAESDNKYDISFEKKEKINDNKTENDNNYEECLSCQ